MKNCRECIYCKTVSEERYCYILKKDIEDFNIAMECNFYDKV